MQNFIKIHEKDNVVVALQDIPAGTRLDILAGGNALEHEGILKGKGALGQEDSLREEAEGNLPEGGGKISVIAREEIPAGHKMSVCDILTGEEVIKYGYRIGNAMADIRAGDWIHTHNLKTALGDLPKYSYEPVFGEAEVKESTKGTESERISEGVGEDTLESSFMGYRRPDGKVGIRNEIWIIPTVGCVNNVASAIAKKANEWLLAMPKGTPYQPKGTAVDEVIAFPHPYGCSQTGEDQEHTRKILADLISHPNAGGVLVLGLGCENSNIQELKPYLGDYDENRVRFLVSQECEDEVAEGLEIIGSLIEQASSFRREPVSVSELVIGLKCGGSDGLSGITANPLVGRFSDRLVSRGGTTILTEVPEMFGAETILMNRCANEELFRQTVDLINDFKNYFKSHGQTIYENPSPGNKKGGISTLEDKSLGCTQKSGSALVRGVLQYGEKVQIRGLNLLSAPGNDLVASTALAAAGAHMVLFTTGRGTPFASPVPTVKISTNSALAEKKSKWIDFNAGALAEDGCMDRETDRLFRYVVEVASGRKVRSEEEGYHDMAIFKQGVTL